MTKTAALHCLINTTEQFQKIAASNVFRKVPLKKIVLLCETVVNLVFRTLKSRQQLQGQTLRNQTWMMRTAARR